MAQVQNVKANNQSAMSRIQSEIALAMKGCEMNSRTPSGIAKEQIDFIDALIEYLEDFKGELEDFYAPKDKPY